MGVCGGYDAYARSIVRYPGKYLGDYPTFLLQNVTVAKQVGLDIRPIGNEVLHKTGTGLAVAPADVIVRFHRSVELREERP